MKFVNEVCPVSSNVNCPWKQETECFWRPCQAFLSYSAYICKMRRGWLLVWSIQRRP